MLKKPLLLLLLCAIAITNAVILFVVLSTPKDTTSALLTNKDQDVHTVRLTKDGFEPEDLVIKKGEKVIFLSEDSIPFWPASSLHPSHMIYPEFDPGDRIMPGNTWEFIFTKVGEWDYHDHINAHFEGTVTVLGEEEENANLALKNTRACKDFHGYEKQQCWDRQLEEVLKAEGVKAAFDFFVELYKTEPDVPKACHEWGHSLGKASYAEYKRTGELDLVPEASYCGYGYFHSFIGELIKDTGNFDAVLPFCDKVEDALKDDLEGVASNCIHGVGHGTTAWLLENPENWGQLQKTIDEGTSVCDILYTTHNDLHTCYDGVFNELHLDIFNSLYGFSYADYIAKNDPFWICQAQKDEHKQPCYFEFVGIFWKIFDLDLSKAIQYVVANTEKLEERGPLVVAKIAADWIQFDIVKESQERNIEACRAIPEFLFASCMHGIANGFIQHGEPGNLHTKGFAFCGAEYLSEKEQRLCFTYFLDMLSTHYSTEDFNKACALLGEKDRIRNCALTAT